MSSSRFHVDDQEREKQELSPEGHASMCGVQWRRQVCCLVHRIEYSTTVARYTRLASFNPREDQISSDSCEICKREAEEAQRRAEREEARRLRIESCQRFLAVPPRFQGASFENYAATTKKQREALNAVRSYYQQFQENHANGRCLVFSGSPGTGKTHLGLALGRSLAGDGWFVQYTQAAEIIRSIKATWHRDAHDDERSVLSEYIKYPLLIVDELGVGFGSETEARFFGEILDGRYRDKKPTVVITNLDANGMRDVLGARSLDRLLERGNKVIIFDWPSHRRSAEMHQMRSADPARNQAVLQ